MRTIGIATFIAAAVVLQLPGVGFARSADAYDTAMTAGREAISQKNFPEAIRSFKLATTIEPTKSNGWLSLAVAYHGAGEGKLGLGALDEYARLEPDPANKSRIDDLRAAMEALPQKVTNQQDARRDNELALEIATIKQLIKEAAAESDSGKQMVLVWRVRKRLLPLVSRLDQNNLELWEAAAKVSLVFNDDPLRVAALESLMRLSPEAGGGPLAAKINAVLEPEYRKTGLANRREALSAHSKALSGDSAAMAAVAKFYMSGVAGSLRNVSEYEAWAIKSAEAGNADGMALLGSLLEAAGRNTRSPSWSEYRESARKWYKRSAELGSAEGMLGYATCLNRGFGGDENEPQSIIWIEKSIEAGCAQAMLVYGDSLSSDGFANIEFSTSQKDELKGKILIRRAASLGNGKAMWLVGNDERENRVRTDWYRLGSAQGDVLSINEMARSYRSTTGRVTAKAEVERWLFRALNAGDSDAELDIAMLFLRDEIFLDDGGFRLEAGEHIDLGIEILRELTERKSTNLSMLRKATSAMKELAEWFSRGPNRDIDQAIFWYTKYRDESSYEPDKQEAERELKKLKAP